GRGARVRRPAEPLADKVGRAARTGPCRVHRALRQHQTVARTAAKLLAARVGRGVARDPPEALIVVVAVRRIARAGSVAPLEHTEALVFEPAAQHRLVRGAGAGPREALEPHAPL